MLGGVGFVRRVRGIAGGNDGLYAILHGVRAQICFSGSAPPPGAKIARRTAQSITSSSIKSRCFKLTILAMSSEKSSGRFV